MSSWYTDKKVLLYIVGGSFLGLVYGLFTLLVERATHDEGASFFIPLAPVVFGVGALAVGLGTRHIRQQVKMLEDARQKFSSLTMEAVTRKDWDISFTDPSIPTCWREKQCGATDCPSYGKEHVRCWLVAGTFCRGEVQGRFAQKFGSCTKCEIYQTAVQQNPINEISENFNNIMWVLREHEDLLEESNNRLKKQFVQLEQLQQRTRDMADSDMLTSLKNHAHFQKYLKEQMEKASIDGEPLSLAIIDLDYFKAVNDDFGHQTGDEVLRQFGRLIRDHMGDGAYAARYGGEEFAVVFNNTGAEDALKKAETMRKEAKKVAGRVDLPGRYIGASIGVADMPACASDPDSLIAAADTALLFSKRSGRNRVTYFLNVADTELGEKDMLSLQSRLEGASFKTITALASAVDSSDQYDSGVNDELLDIARGLSYSVGLDPEQAETLELAVKLHDIGKLGVPDEVLQKQGELSDEEKSRIEQHPRMGQDLLSEAGRIKELITAILYHHERWDGTGYPEHLKGEEIPFMARVVGIMDAYRAMVSDRPYRNAMSRKEAIAELRKGSGKQFDPALVDQFIAQLMHHGESAAA